MLVAPPRFDVCTMPRPSGVKTGESEKTAPLSVIARRGGPPAAGTSQISPATPPVPRTIAICVSIGRPGRIPEKRIHAVGAQERRARRNRPAPTSRARSARRSPRRHGRRRGDGPQATTQGTRHWQCATATSPPSAGTIRISAAPATVSRRVNAMRSPSGEKLGVPFARVIVGQLHAAAAGDTGGEEIDATARVARRVAQHPSVRRQRRIERLIVGRHDAGQLSARAAAFPGACACADRASRRRARSISGTSEPGRGPGPPAPAALRRGRQRRWQDVGLHRLERGPHFTGALVALPGFLGQAARDDRPEHRRHVRRKRMRRRSQNRRGQLELVAAAERVLAGGHLVEDDAERPDVRPRVGRLAEEQLGRDVGDGADERAALGRLLHGSRRVLLGGRIDASRQPEVQDLDAVLLGRRPRWPS